MDNQISWGAISSSIAIGMGIEAWVFYFIYGINNVVAGFFVATFVLALFGFIASILKNV